MAFHRLPCHAPGILKSDRCLNSDCVYQHQSSSEAVTLRKPVPKPIPARSNPFAGSQRLRFGIRTALLGDAFPSAG